jgi:CheY-like chemotaxis protein/HPt (histidine-containing phosphotransfer) domain-containing protein
MRILLVEDNSVNQLVAVAALRRAGFTPDTASSGAEAVQSHALQRFDIIFLDADLPDMDAVDVARQIAQMEEGTGRKTPIIATVSDDAPETRVKLREAGFKGCLGKPLDLDSMVQAVDRWVQPDGALDAKGADALDDAPTTPVAPPPAPIVVKVDAPTSAGPAKSAAAEAPGAADKAADLKIVPLVPPEPKTEAPAEDDDSEPVLDEARLKSSSMGNANLENILIRTFVNHIRPRLERVRAAAASGDAAAIELEAHGIKGMCGTIGAMACADVFARIERLGREKRLEPVKPMLDYAEIEVARVEVLIAPRAKAA